MKKIEFHIHTIASKDSLQNKYFLLFMCKLRKIDCIAITDHNEIYYAQKNKCFFEKHGLDVIVGEEIFTKDGEIIGLFLSDKILPNLSAKETVNEIKKQGGLVYIPHPYDEKRAGTVLSNSSLEKIKKYVDFMEVHNGRNYSSFFSDKQDEITQKYGFIPIVGSDAHTFYEVGRNYCVVDSIDKETLKHSIKKASLIKNKCIKFAHVNTKFVKLIKMLMKGDFYGITRIVNKKIKRGK